MTTRIERAALALCLGALAGCGAPAAPPAQAEQSEAASTSLFAATPEAQWRLPDRLGEISGLAVTPDGRLLAHDDEAGVIYEIDAAEGRLVKAFALGEGVLRGDFEGIAATPEGDLYLATSTGALYRFREGADGAHAPYARFDTGLEHVCEIEGLTYLPARGSLILACKTHHDGAVEDAVALYSWSPAEPGAAARPWLTLAPEIVARTGLRRLNPSSVDIDPESGRVIVLAARQRVLLELSQDGELLSWRRLDRGHVQAEGVAALGNGALVISDEAGELGQAKLTRYGRRS